MGKPRPLDAPRGNAALTLAGAVAFLALGAWLLLRATGSPTLCFAGDCAVPTDAWEPWRLGGALVSIAAGSALMLTAIWRR